MKNKPHAHDTHTHTHTRVHAHEQTHTAHTLDTHILYTERRVCVCVWGGGVSYTVLQVGVDRPHSLLEVWCRYCRPMKAFDFREASIPRCEINVNQRDETRQNSLRPSLKLETSVQVLTSFFRH